MDKKRLLIVSSSLDEAITQWAFKSKICSSEIEVVLLEELLSTYDIKDDLTQECSIIRWFKNESCKFSNITHDLFNRIIYIEDKLFQSFEKDDQEYAQREFEAYLGFALNSFSKVQNIAINGVCERVYSLPSQWMLVEKQLNLNVPSYYWGLKEANPLKKLKEIRDRIIYSYIYNFLNWSNSIEIEKEETQFCFIKPFGEPIFLLSLGDKHFITSSINLSRFQQRSIERILQKIRKLFKYFVFELVLFIHKEKITFGCINIDLIRSSKNPNFNHFMDSHFFKEYYKCLSLNRSYPSNIVQR